MGIVHVLNQETINQIAAGEVIERPASVVKELVENALDSGATGITVEAEQGGISMLRVSDNGSGFAADDIRTAFLRHATSKIETGADLFRIHSLGFRGEALSSIAAVARVELLTYNADDYLGSRYRIEGGQEISLEEAGCPQGTTMIVRDIFYNVPARRKFLKTPVSETGYINELMCRFAIAHPDVSFSLISQGRTLLHTSGNGKLRDAVYAAYGRDIADNLIPVHAETDIVTITGVIGKPIAARSNRNLELCFVNNRDIRSTLITKAIEDAYQGHLMQHRYPFTAINLDIRPETIDVNVHPTKHDVRFSDRDAIYNAVFNAVRAALSETILIPDAAIGEETPAAKTSVPRPAEVFETNRRSAERYTTPVADATKADAVTTENADTHTSTNADAVITTDHSAESTVNSGAETDVTPNSNPSDTANTSEAKSEGAGYRDETKTSNLTEAAEEYSTVSQDRLPGTTAQSAVSSENEPTPLVEKPVNTMTAAELLQREVITGEQMAFVDTKRAPEYRIVGQVFDTYWIIQLDHEMLMMDQHAAHEKINYERLLKQVTEGEVYTQQMTPPAVVSLTIREEEALLNNMEYFTKLGFEIRNLGGREYGIFGVPTVLFDIAPQEYFAQTLDRLTEGGNKEPLLRVLERLASMSCKAAIKGGQTISYSEADHLVAELLTLDNPYQCPHGRPTIISFSEYELEKKFKRIV
ncbi:MAG: DNA mismatch repair endonuclease MutL [Lachnospiraceae bacterium]|nr:DNA mismatch repair endonuclease MutL [Lachnospiraceae bacterium]